MENQPFDAQALMSRASEITKDIRKSDAYPALIGGIAGGIAGGLIAALIAGRVASSRNSVAEIVDNVKAEAGSRWDVKDLVQLATVAAALVKQVQAWYREQKNQRIGTE